MRVTIITRHRVRKSGKSMQASIKGLGQITTHHRATHRFVIKMLLRKLNKRMTKLYGTSTSEGARVMHWDVELEEKDLTISQNAQQSYATEEEET